jgi:hypothetical protein
MARGLAIIVALALAGCGLFDTKEAVCTLDTECPAGTGYGRCVQGHCAFVSDTCASGWRWDETAGDQADMCVPSEAFDPDAAPDPVDAAPPSDAPPLAADASASTPDA